MPDKKPLYIIFTIAAVLGLCLGAFLLFLMLITVILEMLGATH